MKVFFTIIGAILALPIIIVLAAALLIGLVGGLAAMFLEMFGGVILTVLVIIGGIKLIKYLSNKT
jgi:hypothetical protein